MNYFLIGLILSIILVLPLVIYISWIIWSTAIGYMGCVWPHSPHDHMMNEYENEDHAGRQIIIDGTVFKTGNDFIIIDNNESRYIVLINGSWIVISGDLVEIVSDDELLDYINVTDNAMIYGTLYNEENNIIQAYKIYLSDKNILIRKPTASSEDFGEGCPMK